MIRREILGDTDTRVRHVTNADHCRRWLGLDEFLYVVEIAPNDRVKGVINQNHQLKGCVVSLRGNQLSDLEERLTLLYLHLILPQAREFIVTSDGHVRDDYVNWGSPRRSLFLAAQNLSAKCKYKRSFKQRP